MDKKNYLATLLLVMLTLFATACNKTVEEDDDDDTADVKKEKAEKGVAKENGSGNAEVDALVETFLSGKVTQADYTKAIDLFEEMNNDIMNNLDKFVDSSNSEQEFYIKMNLYQIGLDGFQELQTIVAQANPDDVGTENYGRMLELNKKFNEKQSELQSKMAAKFQQSAPGAATDSTMAAPVDSVK